MSYIHRRHSFVRSGGHNLSPARPADGLDAILARKLLLIGPDSDITKVVSALRTRTRMLQVLRLAIRARSRAELKAWLGRMLRIGRRAAGADLLLLRIRRSDQETLELWAPRRIARISEPSIDGLIERAKRGAPGKLVRLPPTVVPAPFRSCYAVSLVSQEWSQGVLCALSRQAGWDSAAREGLTELGALVLTAAEGCYTSVQREELFAAAERGRIARHLHDRPLQVLVNALQSLRLDSAADEVQMRRVLGPLEVAIEELRREIWILRQGQQASRASLSELFASFSRTSHLSLDVQWAVSEDRLPPELQLELFYMVREALFNVYHHAMATRVRVRAEIHSGMLAVNIIDNGAGFDVPAALRQSRGYGLLILEERAAAMGGRVVVRSRRGAGTEIRIRVPVGRGYRPAEQSRPRRRESLTKRPP